MENSVKFCLTRYLLATCNIRRLKTVDHLEEFEQELAKSNGISLVSAKQGCLKKTVLFCIQGIPNTKQYPAVSFILL